jgi:hypothetical protein
MYYDGRAAQCMFTGTSNDIDDATILDNLLQMEGAEASKYPHGCVPLRPRHATNVLDYDDLDDDTITEMLYKRVIDGKDVNNRKRSRTTEKICERSPKHRATQPSDTTDSKPRVTCRFTSNSAITNCSTRKHTALTCTNESRPMGGRGVFVFGDTAKRMWPRGTFSTRIA